MGPEGYHQKEYIHFESPKMTREGKGGQKKYLSSNWKFPKIDETHESVHSRYSKKSKDDKLKDPN